MSITCPTSPAPVSSLPWSVLQRHTTGSQGSGGRGTSSIGDLMDPGHASLLGNHVPQVTPHSPQGFRLPEGTFPDKLSVSASPGNCPQGILVFFHGNISRMLQISLPSWRHIGDPAWPLLDGWLNRANWTVHRSDTATIPGAPKVCRPYVRSTFVFISSLK